MGAWGPGISSNDTFEDITYEFFELYNDGLTPEQVTDKLIVANQEILNDEDDRNNFWFALALAQWECKALDPDLLAKIRTIVETGEDISVWERLDADNSTLSKRKKALDQLLIKLESEKKAPRNRRKKVFRDSIFQKGDCLTFPLDNGNYGAAFVLASEYQTEYGMNLIAVCDHNSKEKPSVTDFENAKVFVRKEQRTRSQYEEYEAVSWYYAQFYKKSQIAFEVVGRLKVSKKYTFQKDFRRFSQWSTIPEFQNVKATYNKEHGEPTKTIKLKKLRIKSWL